MNCRDFVDFLNAYTEGELKEKLRASFERHVGDCPPCRDYLDGYEKTSRLARRCAQVDVAKSDPPEALVRAILAACAEVGCGKANASGPTSKGTSSKGVIEAIGPIGPIDLGEPLVGGCAGFGDEARPGTREDDAPEGSDKE